MSLDTVEYPDASMRYGAVGTQVADVFEPPEPADSLVLLIHGGFWEASDRARTWAAGHALAAAGHLTASVAYRTGAGGWPSALDDLVTAIDQIQLSGREWTRHNEAPRAITLVGHSGGGQLALWAASRASLPPSPWRTDDIQTTGVVALAPVADLRRAAETAVGEGAVARFLGGTPSEAPEAYALADPSALVPSVPVRILHGAADDVVPLDQSERYAAHLRDVGAVDWDLRVVDGVDHTSWGHPASAAWPELVAALDEVAGTS